MGPSVYGNLRAVLPLLAAVALGPAFSAVALAEETEKVELPLGRVVLFSSGVGFFEHAATVDGDATAELWFDVDEINDLLKSMVVRDLDGGRIAAVTYDSRDPITRTLRSFAIDLTEHPTLGVILRQARGEQIAVDAPEKIAGIIVGVEKRPEPVGDRGVVEKEYLNLLTDEGLRSIALDSIGRFRLLNEELDSELRKALAVLATALDADRKAVRLRFEGEGEREVRVGYIRETPVWKTSYRLVLDEEEAPFLQGWAIVENPSEQDWDGVRLSLVSGRPISFKMDLYQPLYVPRPEVELELFASLRPQVYDQDLAAAPPALAEPAAPARRELAHRGAGQTFRLEEAVQPDTWADEAAPAERLDRLQLGRGVEVAAAAGEVGELFQYAIAMPVTIPRQQSAMLPIVGGDVEAEKVSIYNPQVHQKHPLNGLRLTNTTGLHLMQGPITVFDSGAYAGDAQIADIAPGAERLVSYAMDLETEVAPQARSRPDELVSLRLVKGTAITTRKYARAREYTVRNSGSRTKQVLIEQPLEADWTLVSPEEPAEKTRDMYRFLVEAEPGVPAVLTVEEERIDRQQVAMTNLDEERIRIYLSARQVSDAVKDALASLQQRRHELAQVAAEREQRQQRIEEIADDQARIRENMARLDRNSDLYRSYVQRFTDQETEIESLREAIRELQEKETVLQEELDEFLMALDLE